MAVFPSFSCEEEDVFVIAGESFPEAEGPAAPLLGPGGGLCQIRTSGASPPDIKTPRVSELMSWIGLDSMHEFFEVEFWVSAHYL